MQAPVLMQPTLKRWLKTSEQSSNSALILKDKNAGFDAELASAALREPPRCDIGSGSSSSSKIEIRPEVNLSPDKSLDCLPTCIPKKRLSLKRRNKSAPKHNSISTSLQESHASFTPRGIFQIRKRNHTDQHSANIKKKCDMTHQELESVHVSVEDEEMMNSYATVIVPQKMSREVEHREHHHISTPRKSVSIKELSNFELPISPTFSPRKAACSASFSPLLSSLAGHEEKPQTPCFNTSIPLFSTPAHSDSGTPKQAAAKATKRALFHGSTTPNYQRMRSKHESDFSFQDDISLSEFLNCSLSDSNRTYGISQYLVLEVGMQTCMEVNDNGR